MLINYTIQISNTSDFSNIVVNTTLSQNYYTYTVENAVTHYWKVFSNITTDTVSVNEFAPLDAVYVYGDSDSSIKPTGTKDKPFKTISSAIEVAKLINKNIRVAKASIPYIESFILIEGISIYGAFCYSDSWSKQDTNANETIIQSNDISAIIVNNIKLETYIDGFTVKAGTEGKTTAIYSINSNNNMIIQNCKIYGGACTDVSYAIFNGPNGNLTITNCEIYGAVPSKCR